MDITVDVNNSIPLWGMLVAGVAGIYYLIKMDFRIDKRMTLMENDLKTKSETLSKELAENQKTLTEIKRIVFKFLVEDKE